MGRNPEVFGDTAKKFIFFQIRANEYNFLAWMC